MTMIRISEEHNAYLKELAERLSKERGGYVSKTQALAELIEKGLDKL